MPATTRRKKRRNRSQRFNRFRACLLWEGESQESWAKKRGVTASHVAQVARGPRESAKMLAMIDEYIAEVERRVAAEAAEREKMIA